jgi:hypothetical protein
MKIRNLGIILKALIFCVGTVVFASSGLSWVDQPENEHKGKREMVGKTIREVLREHTPELMSTPGVVGTAQGLCDGRPCIKVFAAEKTPELEQKIPDTLEGYPVLIEETGRFRALPRKSE